MLFVVAWVAILLSLASFAVFAAEAISSLRSALKKNSETVAQRAATSIDRPAATLDDINKTAEALAKLADAFAKAGPAVTSLIASILFLLIAGVLVGAFGAPKPAPPAPTPTVQH